MGNHLLSANPVYPNFRKAQQHISGIEAIDYFFAKDLTSALNDNRLSEQNVAVLFHLLLALNESLRNGHSCLPLKSIAKHRFGFLCDQDGIVSHHGFVFEDEESLTSLLTALKVSDEDRQPIVLHRGCLYLRRYYQFEQELSDFITAKLNSGSEYQLHDIQSCLSSLFELAPEDAEVDWQLIAVANAINKNFSVIAGGPGTGKTYTVTKLLAALTTLHQQKNGQDRPLKIALVAPTGKAAQRLSESIGNAISKFRGQVADVILDAIPEEAQTIHRLLGVTHNSPNFRHNQDNQLDVDVLLIDEVSMVDLALMTRVFRALAQTTKVILLGDADQLPSVGVGSVLADIAPRPHRGYSANNINYLTAVTQVKSLTKTNKESSDHVAFLLKSRRFDGEGGIGRIATAVINGQGKQSWELLVSESNRLSISEQNYTSQLQLYETQPSDWLPDLVSKYYAPIYRLQSVDEAYSQLGRFRVLCATRQGEFGVEKTNELIQSLLVTQGAISSNHSPYHGQPIMISENDYRLGLYNGDVGIMWRNKDGHLMAMFENQDNAKPNNFTQIIPSRLPKYETVYAMTIHKTQGSEFEHVAMLLPKRSDNRLLSRELLYTGITRAKKQLSIACTANVWCQGVESQVKRFSGLTLY